MDEIGLKHPIMFDLWCFLVGKRVKVALPQSQDTKRHVRTFWARIQNARHKGSTSCKNGGNNFGVELLCSLIMTFTRYANAISFFTRTLQSYEQRLFCRQVWRPNIICSCQLEIRAIAALFRRERYSGQLYDGITWQSHWSRCISVCAVIAGYTK